MSSLPAIEVFLRADPLEAVVVSDPPVNIEQPIFQLVNLDGVLTDDDIGITIQPYDADYSDIKAKVESINAEDFATAAQGSLAETAIQPDDLSPYALSSDVSIALGDKVDRVAGKGLSTEDYTSEEKTKLLGIEQGAQVNPDLSGYAPTNNATFTGSLILPNNSRINSVEHFYQTTKPVTRGDGSALAIGDRWWKIDTGNEWFWNGTYWLSKDYIYSQRNFANGVSSIGFQQRIPTANFTMPGPCSNKKLFIKQVWVQNALSQPQIDSWTLNNSNYFTYRLLFSDRDIALSIVKSPSDMGMTSSATYPLGIVYPVSILINPPIGSSTYLYGGNVVGSPSLPGTSWGFYGEVTYAYVYE